MTPGAKGSAMAAAGRGALIGVPVLIVIGVMLAGADPIFRSWFDLPALGRHLLLLCAGAWAALGLARAASDRDPAPALPRPPALGAIEAICVLGGLCALYSAFVVAQFVALSGAGHRILVTQGMTYAQYARGGFFQLLGCAAITLLVLLGIRACARAARWPVPVLSGLTALLTVGVVVVAFRRLELYEAAYGLTMLRLACMFSAVWIGVVFVLLALSLPRRGLRPDLLPAVVIGSGLLVIASWGLSNPAGFVAAVNTQRAAAGHQLDVAQAMALGPDGLPSLIGGLGRLRPADQMALRNTICVAGPPPGGTGVGYNLSLDQAGRAYARTCGR